MRFLFFATSLIVLSFTQGRGQLPAAAPVVSELPFPTQVRRTVMFLRSDCLHDFNPDLPNFNYDNLSKRAPGELGATVQDLIKWTNDLATIPASRAKLTQAEIQHLQQPFPQTADQNKLALEGEWRMHAVSKLNSFTLNEMLALSTQQLALTITDRHYGTGFIIAYPDSRFKDKEGVPTKGRGFAYLVTNHHVSEPGIEFGKPCQIPAGTTLFVNHKPDGMHTSQYAEKISFGIKPNWNYSKDPSVDLAVTEINISQSIYDYDAFSTDMILPKDDLDKRAAVEGDPVLFAGLFVQYFADEVSLLEPIVRSGTVAMIPSGLLPTTINSIPGHVILSDAHVFGGNSGSPVFVDVARFAGSIGINYRMLGIVSGEVFENTDFTLNVSTTASGKVGANSGVSIVVPAWQLLEILRSPYLTRRRDANFVEQK